MLYAILNFVQWDRQWSKIHTIGTPNSKPDCCPSHRRSLHNYGWIVGSRTTSVHCSPHSGKFKIVHSFHGGVNTLLYLEDLYYSSSWCILYRATQFGHYRLSVPCNIEIWSPISWKWLEMTSDQLCYACYAIPIVIRSTDTIVPLGKQ